MRFISSIPLHPISTSVLPLAPQTSASLARSQGTELPRRQWPASRPSFWVSRTSDGAVKDSALSQLRRWCVKPQKRACLQDFISQRTHPIEDEVDVTISDFPHDTSNDEQRQKTATTKTQKRESHEL